MPTRPESKPRRPDVTKAELIGGIEKRRLTLVEYDSNWPFIFDEQLVRIQRALGRQALSIEHIGSTSVPGLAAKPIIDILATVADITAEEDYLNPLLKAGYELRVREPGHRMVRTPTRDVQVHLLEACHPSVDAYLQLRSWLRNEPADRELYARTKRELLTHDWTDMNAYAAAKTEVIEGMLSRARAALSRATI